MTISHHTKLIFIHVHRTGGTTLNNLLIQALGDKVEVQGEHVNLSESLELILKLQKEYFTFGFIRNPWDRMLSWYSLIHQWNPQPIEVERQQFEKFIKEDQAFQQGDQFFHYNQLDYFPTKGDALQFVNFFRYEQFQKEVERLFQSLKLPLKEIPLINSTPPKDHQDYFTDRSIELIAQKCAKDIEYFGYSFG